MSGRIIPHAETDDLTHMAVDDAVDDAVIIETKCDANCMLMWTVFYPSQAMFEGCFY